MILFPPKDGKNHSLVSPKFFPHYCLHFQSFWISHIVLWRYVSSIRRCLLPQRHRLRESSFRPGTAVVELINCVFAMMPLCKTGGLETRCSGKQKIGVLFLKAAAMGSQICWQRLILVGPHCRKGRKGKLTLWSEDKSSLYNVQARESYYFIEQRVAERTGCLRWVGHMLYILP